MVFINPHKTGQDNPLYTQNNQFFFHSSIQSFLVQGTQT